MSRNTGKIPKYSLHKPSGQARVIIGGRHIYLGRFGSPESREKYGRLIAECWGRSPKTMPSASSNGATLPEISINELILAYWDFAKTYYCKNGKPTKELACMRDALRPLRELYGSIKVGEFGPKSLVAVRRHMIEQNLTRRLINHRIGRIKRVFKWGVAEELVPPSVYHGLQAVTGLQYGRTHAREAKPIKPVENSWVKAVLPYVSPQVSAMIQIQQLTGMRPCEVVLMRLSDINRGGDIWVYEPHDHKNKWRGHERKIPLGPKAQEILQPFLRRDSTAYLFSPAEAEEWRHAQRRIFRKTPMTPSQRKRKPKARPKRHKGNRYTPSSYRGAVIYGIRKANKDRNNQPLIPHWFPLQLRHSRATEVRHRYGLDAAQVALGHVRADVTEVYAERNLELATQIARETG